MTGGKLEIYVWKGSRKVEFTLYNIIFCATVRTKNIENRPVLDK